MASYVVSEAVGLLKASGVQPKSARALVLGLTFKENIPDVRNSQPMALVEGLESQGVNVFVHDPIVNVVELSRKFIADPFNDPDGFDLVVLAVPHTAYLTRTPDAYVSLLRGEGKGVFVDVRGALGQEAFAEAEIAYWQL